MSAFRFQTSVVRRLTTQPDIRQHISDIRHLWLDVWYQTADIRRLISDRYKGGAVVRALASRQCGPASNLGVDAICGLSLLLVLSLAPRGFSLGTPVFPSPQKPILPNSNSIWNARTRLKEFILTPKCFVGKQAIFFRQCKRPHWSPAHILIFYTWYQTSDIRHLLSDVWCETADIRRLITEIWDQTSDIRHLTSDVWYQTSEMRRPIPETSHQTSDIRPLLYDCYNSDIKLYNCYITMLYNIYNCYITVI